jgi:hypothetical protein
MIVYLINILLIGLYSLIYNFKFKGSKKAKVFFISLAVLQLIFLLTFKDIYLGSDMPNYWDYFQEQMLWSLTSLGDVRFEIAFKALTKAVTLFSDNQQFYLGVIAFLTIIPVGFVSYRYSKMPFLTILLYILLGFYAFSFSGLRQSIAIGLILISYHFIYRAKLLPFLLTVIFATLFHFSAIVFLPVYLIRNIKLSNNRIVLIGILASLLFIFKAQILTVFTNLFYPNYAVVETDSYTWTLMNVLIFIFTLAYYNRVVSKDSRNGSLYVIVLIGIFMLLFSSVADNVMRVANYFLIFLTLLLPEVLSSIGGAKKRAIMTGVVLLGCIIVYLYLLQADGYNIVPYKFVFEQMKVN